MRAMILTENRLLDIRKVTVVNYDPDAKTLFMTEDGTNYYFTGVKLKEFTPYGVVLEGTSGLISGMGSLPPLSKITISGFL